MQIKYLWEALPVNQKYKYYDEFEKSYVALLFSKTDKIDIIWTSVNVTNSYSYTFDMSMPVELAASKSNPDINKSSWWRPIAFSCVKLMQQSWQPVSTKANTSAHLLCVGGGGAIPSAL